MNEVVVAGAAVSEADIHREAQYHPASHWGAACHEATRALVIRELMLSRAEELGLCEQHPQLDERDSQAVISQLMDHELTPPEVSERECRAYHAAHPGRFLGPELMEASHILLIAPVAERESTRAKADDLLTQLQSRPERFERLARQHSGCPSAASGGHLGQISPGDTLPEFESALKELRPGEIAPRLVETRHGFHIILLNQRSEGRLLPYDAVARRLQAYLSEREWRRSLRDYVGQLADRYGVQGFDIASKAPEAPAETGEKLGAAQRHTKTGAINGVPTRPSAHSAPAVDPRRRLPLIS